MKFCTSWWLTDVSGVAARQVQELVDVLLFCWSPVCDMQFRNEDLVSSVKFGSEPGNFQLQ